MESLKNLSPNEIINRSFDCSCGRKHSVPIERIEYQSGSLLQLPLILRPYRNNEILLVSDDNTYGVIGRKLHEQLSEQGFSISLCCFHREHPLVPDEKALGELMLNLGDKTAFILAVGSGVINDLCKYISARVKIPYGIIATAPSMDGYASSVSPLIVQGRKVSFIVGYPKFIMSEPDIFKNAPEIMIQAGFGDVLGKLTALTDWHLSALIFGEHQCEECIQLVGRAVEAVIECSEGLVRRQGDSAVKLMDALILSGLAMGLYGNSRPASGAEHHLSHYWEMDALEKGEKHALHGNMVGVACYVSALAYRKAGKLLPDSFILPDAGKIHSLLQMMHMPANPAALGISRETFHTGMLKALFIRDRFTILRLLKDNGLLEETAEQLTAYFYQTP